MTPAESETVAVCWLIVDARPVAGYAIAEHLRRRPRLSAEARAALLAAAVLGGCGLGLLGR